MNKNDENIKYQKTRELRCDVNFASRAQIHTINRAMTAKQILPPVCHDFSSHSEKKIDDECNSKNDNDNSFEK